MVFNCKMCGANLNITEGMKICKCSYCDSFQTVPDISSEKKLRLFNLANKYRTDFEFDKAADIYKSITVDFPSEPEAYWGLCLCKYGIEYVKDPASLHRIPTCHRTSFERILDMPDFRKTLEYSDPRLRSIYTQEAQVIDNIQQNIISIAAHEKPFDVFICYKETAHDGSRTEDAVIARQIYESLTKEGIKVFFAGITLKDKLGTEYEPYIFSAINSAQIMVCIGTSAEYFESPWVKNEWSRFLDIMKRDKSKMLIPCYKYIPVSGIPTEFQGFQAQDMNLGNAVSQIYECICNVLSASSAAKSQLDTLFEQYEMQLRSERTKYKFLDNKLHMQAVEEKRNADSLFRKEKPNTGALLFINAALSVTISMIFFIVLLSCNKDPSMLTVFLIMIVTFWFIAAIAASTVIKRKKKAIENYITRLSYDENAPDYESGSSDEKRKKFEKENAAMLREKENISQLSLVLLIIFHIIGSMFMGIITNLSYNNLSYGTCILIWFILPLFLYIPIIFTIHRSAEKNYKRRLSITQ